MGTIKFLDIQRPQKQLDCWNNYQSLTFREKKNRGGESTPLHLSIIHSSSVYQVNYLHNKLNENKFPNISGHGDKKAVISRIIIFQIKFFFFQWQTRPYAGQLVQHRSNLIAPLSTWGSLNSRTLFLQYLMVPLSTWCSL
jgi:hypothetical protein